MKRESVIPRLSRFFTLCKKLTLFVLIGLSFAGCSSQEKVLKIAATSIPHADLLEVIKSELAAEGTQLKIIEVDDYNLPNRLLYEGEVDANFFQHIVYLEEQNKRFDYHIVPLVGVHIEPLGIYSRRCTSLEELNDGSTVAIPSDPTNEARALTLLAEIGLITLAPEGANALATVLDIAENPKKLKFEEVDAAFLPRVLLDVELALIPANFALQAKLNPSEEALVLETSHSPYVNVVGVRAGEEEREELQKLARALRSKKLRDHIQKKYHGAILPVEPSSK